MHQSAAQPSARTIGTIYPKVESHGHSVQFYESDAFLAKVVADYIANGLGNGQPAVVIATAAHLQQVWGRLRLKGFEVDLLEQSGQLQLLDAEAVMNTFLVKQRPDRERFNSTIHGIMRRASNARPNRTVRAYGEMVDVLTRTDNLAGAVELERLWNEAGKKYDFSLLCGYDMRSFTDAKSATAYAAVCDLHDHVYRSEA